VSSSLSDEDDERTLNALEVTMTLAAAITVLWVLAAIIRGYKDHKRAK
jgi:hypothetical protein